MNKKSYILAAVFCIACDLHADNITFADQYVKALCIQNWDGNGDGELSTDEASAVTELGTVFKENKSIASFEELQFFTGLTTISDYAFHKSTIQTVVFPETVTEIGEYAFSESGISGELRIPGTVKTIKNYAFEDCKMLTSVILEEGVERFGFQCFTGPIRTLSLPTTLTFISSMAIDPYVNADPSAGIFIPEGDLYVYVRTAAPAAINSFAFYYVFDAGHLVVPLGAVDAYKAASGWSRFRAYLEYGDVNEDGIVDESDLTAIEDYISSGESAFNPLLSDVNFDGVTDGQDVEYLRNYIGSSTSVSSISLTPVDTYIYTIDGRRLPDKVDVSSLPRGIYISNGRKFIVK